MYPSLLYRFLNISAITTSEVTDGRKYAALKNSFSLPLVLSTSTANAVAKVVVIGTVTNTKISVFDSDLRKA
jgi:hypothetical protein